MTQVYAQVEGTQHLLTLDGHATGNSEVCAAVSGLVYALAGYLTNASHEGTAQGVELTLESARARICCRGGEAVAAVFGLTVIGLLQIEQRYPQLVAVEVKEK